MSQAKMRQTSLRMPAKLLSWLDRQAAMHGIDRSDVIRNTLTYHMLQTGTKALMKRFIK